MSIRIEQQSLVRCAVKYRLRTDLKLDLGFVVLFRIERVDFDRMRDDRLTEKLNRGDK